MEIASDNVVSLSVALCVSVHVSSSEELLLLLSTAPSPGSCRSNGHSDVSLRLPVSAVAAFIATARNSCLSRQPQLLLPAQPQRLSLQLNITRRSTQLFLHFWTVRYHRLIYLRNVTELSLVAIGGVYTCIGSEFVTISSFRVKLAATSYRVCIQANWGNFKHKL